MIHTTSHKLLQTIKRLFDGFSLSEISSVLHLTIKIIRTRSSKLEIFDGHTFSETLEKAKSHNLCSDMVAIFTIHHINNTPSINELAYFTQFCSDLKPIESSNLPFEIKWTIGSSSICVSNQVITIIASHNLKEAYD